MLRRVVSAAILIALLFSYSPVFAQSLTKADMLADYDQMWDILEENYPFFPVLRRQGIDPERIKVENREALLREVDNFDEFTALVQNTFSRMDGLAHLQIVSADSYDTYYEQFEWPESVRKRYSQMKRSPGQKSPYPQAEASWLPQIKAVLFRFPTFSDPSALKADRGFVADFLEKWPEAEHIIFDITGNPGGNASYWIENIVAPFGGAYVWERDNYFKASPMTADILAAYPCEEVTSEGHPPFVDELGFTHLLRTRDVYPTGAPAQKTIESTAKRWVLIDGAVFSAADGFAAFCKATGWATLVGKQTHGDGADAFTPQAAALEHTGLLIRFSISSCANANGSLNAQAGTLPDVICRPGELPYWALMRVIGD